MIGEKENGKVIKIKVLMARSGKVSESTESKKECAMLKIARKSIPDRGNSNGKIKVLGVRINLI